MTIIAWDGKTLAADRMATIEGRKLEVTKIWRLPDGRLIGASGTAAMAQRWREWMTKGGERDEVFDDEDNFPHGIEIKLNGECWTHSRFGSFLVESRYVAVGSGHEVASTAMHLGKTAPEAVRVCAEITNHCGLGVDTLELESVALSAAAE